MRPLTPRGPWWRGLDLNRRPLGYEGNFGEDSALLSPAKYPSSMTIAHSGASRSSDLVAQPSPLGLPPHGIEHLGIDPNGDPRRRRIGRPLFAAPPARADCADPFTVVSPPHGIGHDEHAARRRAAQSVLQRRRAS